MLDSYCQISSRDFVTLQYPYLDARPRHHTFVAWARKNGDRFGMMWPSPSSTQEHQDNIIIQPSKVYERKVHKSFNTVSNTDASLRRKTTSSYRTWSTPSGVRLIPNDIYIAQPHVGMAAFVRKQCWLPLPSHQLNHLHNMSVDHGIYVMRDSKQITECLFSHSGSWNTADVLSTVVHKRLGGLAALPSLT